MEQSLKSNGRAVRLSVSQRIKVGSTSEQCDHQPDAVAVGRTCEGTGSADEAARGLWGGPEPKPNQKPRKTGRGQRNPEPDPSPPCLPIVSCVTLNESLNPSGLFPDKEELESLLR